MAIPQQADFILPTLEMAARSSALITQREIVAELVAVLSLTESDLAVRTASGHSQVDKHTAWAVYLLRKAHLLESASRGKYRITQRGRDLLSSNRQAITQASLLMLATSETQTDEQISETNLPPSHSPLTEEASLIAGVLPEDRIASGYQDLQEQLASDLLDRVKEISPADFEALVVDLLVKMGYGAGQRIGRSGDGGIDGIITQDRLGFENIYVQAKRWTDTSIREVEIRNFSGSLDSYGATKGVFITTARFSEKARSRAEKIRAGGKILRLIDGLELSRLLIEYGIAVVTKAVYEIKELDENYFADASG